MRCNLVGNWDDIAAQFGTGSRDGPMLSEVGQSRPNFAVATNSGLTPSATKLPSSREVGFGGRKATRSTIRFKRDSTRRELLRSFEYQRRNGHFATDGILEQCRAYGQPITIERQKTR
jgi:hypothetical protein